MSAGPVRLVLGVDVLLRAAFDRDCQSVLGLWRDGFIMPVVTRPLLKDYLTTLQRLGLSEEVIRGWAAWLTARERTAYWPTQAAGAAVPESSSDAGEFGVTRLDLYVQAAQLGGAAGIVTNWPKPAAASSGLEWVSPKELLQRLFPGV